MQTAGSAQVLVTGGSGGIGEAIVRRFADDGFRVAFTHLGEAEKAAELEAADNVHAIESDTSNVGAVEWLHSEVQPEILICCAGITHDRMMWKQPVADFDQVLAVNLRGAWLQVRAAAPAMRAAEWGRIILIGSINGSRGKAGQTAYAASKAGLIGLARSAARELGPKGITVNVIEPGWVDTPMTRATPLEFQEAARAEAVTGKLSLPEDVAAACAFLAAPAAGQITGQVLRVDGGQCLG